MAGHVILGNTVMNRNSGLDGQYLWLGPGFRNDGPFVASWDGREVYMIEDGKPSGSLDGSAWIRVAIGADGEVVVGYEGIARSRNSWKRE